MPRHKRTGLRKPKNYLKTWGDKDFTRRVSPRLSVGMVDEELPFGKEGGRKSWYLSLTQDPDLLKALGPVKGRPTQGTTLLLFEDDVIALVQHLADTGLVMLDDAGRILNGPALEYEDAVTKVRT
jgi:hypothetical protein